MISKLVLDWIGRHPKGMTTELVEAIGIPRAHIRAAVAELFLKLHKITFLEGTERFVLGDPREGAVDYIALKKN